MESYRNYDNEDWSDYAPVVFKESETNTREAYKSDETEPIKNKTKFSTPVLTVQLILCLCLITGLLLLKTFDNSSFRNIKDWYNSELTSNLYFSGNFNQLDYSSIFESSADEI